MSALALAAAGTGVVLSGAQAPDDRREIGPQVGSRAPEFQAMDQLNRTLTLRAIMGPKGAVLVFFRSADW